MKRNIFFVVSLIFFSLSAYSQAVTLSVEQKEAISKRAQEKVSQMGDYIEYMANKEYAVDKRKYYRKKGLNLFIGKGYEYEEGGVAIDGVKMETTSLNRKSTSTQLVRAYFSRLINLSYDKVVIQGTDVIDIKVGHLKRVGDNEFTCTCYYVQKFCGYKDGKPIYCDRTEKSVSCHIYAEEVETDDGGTGIEFILMLGDVYAGETTKL